MQGLWDRAPPARRSISQALKMPWRALRALMWLPKPIEPAPGIYRATPAIPSAC